MLAMSDTKVYQGQSFLDKALEATGSTETAFEMALLNGVSMTDPVAPGQELEPGKVIRKVVVRFFTDQNRPASALQNNTEEDSENDGIGYMAIGNNFIVK
jgi:hypothetical protein